MEILGRAVIFQYMGAAALKPAIVRLGVDTAAGVIFGDIVPFHEPLYPVFRGGSDGDGGVTQVCKTAFKEGNGVDGDIPAAGNGIQPPLYFGADRTVGDGIQIF